MAQVLTSCHMLVLVAFCCLTHLILRLIHGLGALFVVVVVVVVFHDFSPRKLNYEHATWHRCSCPASYKWLFVV